MTLRDPFQKTYTSLEEMLANPGSRLRENPSKAYENIVNAVKETGGWIQKKGEHDPDYFYGVLSGPYAGTYIMGYKKFQYKPRFLFGLSVTVQTLSLVRRMNDAVLAKIGPLRKAVDEALEKIGKRYADNTPNMDDTWWERHKGDLEYELQDARESGEEVARVGRLSGQVSRAVKAPDTERKKHEEVNRINAALKSGPRRIAEALYILCEVSGTPQSHVIESLQEQPKRILTLIDRTEFIPTRLTDRKRFGAELLRTWSYKAALKRIVPGVEGDLSPFVGSSGTQRVARLRAILSGVPSWKQIALREVPEERTEPIIGALRAMRSMRGEATPPVTRSAERRIEEFLSKASMLYADLKELGVRDGEFRELLQKRGLDWMTHFRDALRSAQEGREVLAETNEGRQVIRALNERDWVRVHREHDRAVEASVTARNRGMDGEQDEASSEAFKSRARQFTLIEGVRPLTTNEEYKCEGTEMRHCVYSMGYFYKKDSFEFAFKAPDGTRATLELAKNGVVRQFFGPRDSTPSKATKQMLQEFLEVNASNIAAMKKGQFPLKQNPLNLTLHRNSGEALPDPSWVLNGLGLPRHPKQCPKTIERLRVAGVLAEWAAAAADHIDADERQRLLEKFQRAQNTIDRGEPLLAEGRSSWPSAWETGSTFEGYSEGYGGARVANLTPSNRLMSAGGGNIALDVEIAKRDLEAAQKSMERDIPTPTAKAWRDVSRAFRSNPSSRANGLIEVPKAWEDEVVREVLQANAAYIEKRNLLRKQKRKLSSASAEALVFLQDAGPGKYNLKPGMLMVSLVPIEKGVASFRSTPAGGILKFDPNKIEMEEGGRPTAELREVVRHELRHYIQYLMTARTVSSTEEAHDKFISVKSSHGMPKRKARNWQAESATAHALRDEEFHTWLGEEVEYLASIMDRNPDYKAKNAMADLMKSEPFRIWRAQAPEKFKIAAGIAFDELSKAESRAWKAFWDRLFASSRADAAAERAKK
jgi:hypothetical protein